VAAAANRAAAEERLRLSKLSWFRVLFVGDATSANTPTDHVFGPALRFTVPIFNQGQGIIARAKADAERACRTQQTVHNQIVLDVYRAYAQYLQARSEIEVLQQKVRPEVVANINRAKQAYSRGNVPYLIVLEATRQLIDTFLREAQLHADLRRTWAELERSVGRHLETPDKKPDPRQGTRRESILDLKPDQEPEAKPEVKPNANNESKKTADAPPPEKRYLP
jgi:cobalt-zinc-cadmium efflux system outer membrane protein